MSKPEALLLDLGGVVIDIDFRRVFSYWAERAGTSAQTLESRWVMNDAFTSHDEGAISFDQFALTLSDQLAIDLTAHEWKQGWNALFIEPFSGVAEALEQLDGRPVYAFSNTNATHLAFMRARYAAVLDTFQHVYASNEIGWRKPDPDAFRYVCAQLDLPPEAVAFADDSSANVEGATAAGLRAVQIAGEADVLAFLDAF